MREISIRKLHEATGKFVREAASEPYVVTDRGRPVAVLGPVTDLPKGTPFAKRRLLPALARMKKIRGDSTRDISEDRDRW